MSKPPKKCPICGSKKWVCIDKKKKGLSAKKGAAAGIAGALFAPAVGLAGVALGASLGKKHKYYVCKDCGFEHEY